MSDHTVRLKSTPVKPTKPPPLTRREMSTMHLPAGCLVPNSEFCQTWLNVHEKLKALASDTKLLELAEDVKKSKKTCYAKIEKLLNYISDKIDMDNCANLAATAQAEEKDDEDEPLRYRTGTPKFIARSVALGRLLSDFAVVPMPNFKSDISGKYQQAYRDDTSDLRALSDSNGTTHGSRLSRKLKADYEAEPSRRFDDFEHHPRHDAESVYWCIVVFVLLAKPLHSDVVEDNVGLRDIWLSIADHEIGTSNDNRVPVIQLNKWAKWLHKDLGFVAPLMVSLTRQVRPEWGLLRPPPRPLHLHEAMQRLILEHVNTWETKELNVQLDTHTPRSYPKVERVPKAPGRHYPIIGQIHSASSLGKRVSHTLAGPGPKRRRKTNIRLPDGPLPPLPPLGMAWATLFGPPQPLLHSSEDDYGDEDEETSD